MVAAAKDPGAVQVIVSRGAPPDVADEALSRVRATVVMIVGGAHYQVIDLDGFTAKRLACPYEREVVPGATPLFKEPVSLKQVVDLVGDRFASNPTHAGAGS